MCQLCPTHAVYCFHLLHLTRVTNVDEHWGPGLVDMSRDSCLKSCEL